MLIHHKANRKSAVQGWLLMMMNICGVKVFIGGKLNKKKMLRETKTGLEEILVGGGGLNPKKGHFSL